MGKRQGSNRLIDLHKARERLLQMIGSDEATFTMSIGSYQEPEYLDITLEYEICGVRYERKRSRLKIIISICSVDPPEARLEPSLIRERMMEDISKRCPFLLKDTYTLYFDKDSISNLHKEARLREFSENLDYLTSSMARFGITADDMLPLLLANLKGCLGESSYSTIEEIEAGRSKPEAGTRMIVEINPPGVPCPHCNGHLSEQAVKELLMKIYLKYHRGGDYPE
jgi:hypothetical protein